MSWGCSAFGGQVPAWLWCHSTGMRLLAEVMRSSSVLQNLFPKRGCLKLLGLCRQMAAHGHYRLFGSAAAPLIFAVIHQAGTAELDCMSGLRGCKGRWGDV